MARRHKKPLDPISLEELTNAPAMSGFVSFLNVKPWETEVVEEGETTGVETATAVTARADKSSAADPLVESTPVETPAPDTTPIDTGPVIPTRLESPPVVSGPDVRSRPPRRGGAIEPTVGISTPVVSTILPGDSVFARRPRVHEVRSLPDSLSFGEEALYNGLWANAVHHTAGARRITIGFERMSRIARLTDKNCKLNCRALIQKRVVEEIADTNFREGRTYLVYSPESALERQRQAGLTHVIRTRGVVFIDAATGRELTTKQWRRRSSRVGTTGVV